MAEYALIFGGAVAQVSPETFVVHSDLVWTGDISVMSPAPQPGWTAAETGGTWTFAAPVAPTLTLVQQAENAIGAGLAITSTSTPALNGNYATDPNTQSHIQSEMLSVIVNSTFADGTTSVAWPDITGAVRTFSVAEFKALALAIGAYVAALYKVANGTSTTLPAATAIIA
jgi:hypothetical protein